MTLLELIETLQRLIKDDPKATDYEVFTEGCDCYGIAKDAHIETHTVDSPYVLIERTDV